jgi:hypothetical protein
MDAPSRLEVPMAKILCPKGHEKAFFGNPCMECTKEGAQAVPSEYTQFLMSVADASGTLARKAPLKLVTPIAKSDRYQVEADPLGYWVIDTTIEDGETPSNVAGFPTREEAEAHARKLNEACPEGCCSRCWEKGKEMEATSDDGTLCEEHVRERIDFKRGDL